MAPTQELTGEALDQRARELNIEGRSEMNADQKRDAIARAESGDGSAPDSVQPGDPTGDPDTTSPVPGAVSEDDVEFDGELGDIDTEQSTIASREANFELEHTRGGTTTREDLTDQGVPMLQGERTEDTGPEDALGVGPKRGDYRHRVVGDPHEVVPTGIDPGTPVVNEDGGVDMAPIQRVVSQRQRAEDIGNVEGEKGGVDTDPRPRF